MASLRGARTSSRGGRLPLHYVGRERSRSEGAVRSGRKLILIEDDVIAEEGGRGVVGTGRGRGRGRGSGHEHEGGRDSGRQGMRAGAEKVDEGKAAPPGKKIFEERRKGKMINAEVRRLLERKNTVQAKGRGKNLEYFLKHIEDTAPAEPEGFKWNRRLSMPNLPARELEKGDGDGKESRGGARDGGGAQRRTNQGDGDRSSRRPKPLSYGRREASKIRKEQKSPLEASEEKKEKEERTGSVDSEVIELDNDNGHPPTSSPHSTPLASPAPSPRRIGLNTLKASAEKPRVVIPALKFLHNTNKDRAPDSPLSSSLSDDLDLYSSTNDRSGTEEFFLEGSELPAKSKKKFKRAKKLKIELDLPLKGFRGTKNISASEEVGSLPSEEVVQGKGPSSQLRRWDQEVATFPGLDIGRLSKPTTPTTPHEAPSSHTNSSPEAKSQETPVKPARGISPFRSVQVKRPSPGRPSSVRKASIVNEVIEISSQSSLSDREGAISGSVADGKEGEDARASSTGKIQDEKVKSGKAEVQDEKVKSRGVDGSGMHPISDLGGSKEAKPSIDGDESDKQIKEHSVKASSPKEDRLTVPVEKNTGQFELEDLLDGNADELSAGLLNERQRSALQKASAGNQSSQHVQHNDYDLPAKVSEADASSITKIGLAQIQSRSSELISPPGLPVRVAEENVGGSNEALIADACGASDRPGAEAMVDVSLEPTDEDVLAVLQAYVNSDRAQKPTKTEQMGNCKGCKAFGELAYQKGEFCSAKCVTKFNEAQKEVSKMLIPKFCTFCATYFASSGNEIYCCEHQKSKNRTLTIGSPVIVNLTFRRSPGAEYRFMVHIYRPQSFPFPNQTGIVSYSPFPVVHADSVGAPSYTLICGVCNGRSRLVKCSTCPLAFHGKCARRASTPRSLEFKCHACACPKPALIPKGQTLVSPLRDSFTNLSRDVAAGNAIDMVLHPALHAAYIREYGHDWHLCYKCGQIALLSDQLGGLSETLEFPIPYRCSNPHSCAQGPRDSDTAENPAGTESNSLVENIKALRNIKSQRRALLFSKEFGERDRELFGWPPLGEDAEDDEGPEGGGRSDYIPDVLQLQNKSKGRKGRGSISNPMSLLESKRRDELERDADMEDSERTESDDEVEQKLEVAPEECPSRLTFPQIKRGKKISPEKSGSSSSSTSSFESHSAEPARVVPVVVPKISRANRKVKPPAEKGPVKARKSEAAGKASPKEANSSEEVLNGNVKNVSESSLKRVEGNKASSSQRKVVRETEARASSSSSLELVEIAKEGGKKRRRELSDDLFDGKEGAKKARAQESAPIANGQGSTINLLSDRERLMAFAAELNVSENLENTLVDQALDNDVELLMLFRTFEGKPEKFIKHVTRYFERRGLS